METSEARPPGPAQQMSPRRARATARYCLLTHLCSTRRSDGRNRRSLTRPSRRGPTPTSALARSHHLAARAPRRRIRVAMLPEPRSPLSLQAQIFATNCQPTESTSSKTAAGDDDSDRPPTFPVYYNFALIGSFDFSSCVPLPADPRLWSRSQVGHWCDLMSQRLLLWPPIDAARFPFNGRALCVLNRKMWATRAPHCWQLLETDIRHRMAALLADDSEVGWPRK